MTMTTEREVAWQPMRHSGNGRMAGSVCLQRRARNAVLIVGSDLMRQMGSPTHAEISINLGRSACGLTAAVARPGPSVLSGHSVNGLGSRGFSAVGMLSALGKRVPSSATTLPHHWDGDVLVIDFSGLPDATPSESQNGCS